jgi:hypothetical protein
MVGTHWSGMMSPRVLKSRGLLILVILVRVFFSGTHHPSTVLLIVVGGPHVPTEIQTLVAGRRSNNLMGSYAGFS